MEQQNENESPIRNLMPLDESIMKSKKCVELMVDNRYMDAVELSSQLSDCSLYHSHCHSMLLFFKVYMSLELPEVKKAEEASQKTIKLCEEIRSLTLRDNFFVKMFFDHDYNQFSDEELHAELIRAEQTVFATLMEFFVDQSIFVLMKVSYRLRSVYMMFKSFAKILDTKEWSSETSASTFNTGVKLGLGIYNLMFSMVPERLMSILSMVGFKGSKYEGLALLREAGSANDIRSFVAQMMVSLYECYLDQMWNVRSTSTINTVNYIQLGLKTNSLSIWYSLFKGRISLIEHNLEQAIKDFEGCVKLKNCIDIKQLTTLYHWELMWCYALDGDWKKAIQCSHDLRNMCVWSQSTLLYLEASFRIMYLETKLLEDQPPKPFQRQQNGKGKRKQKQVQQQQQQSSTNDETIQQQRDKIHDLLTQVPEKVKRYAGRRLPMEKFACEKVIKYQQEGRLTCPAYELFITWNHLTFIDSQEKYLLPIINHVDKYLKKFSSDLSDESYFLLMLIKGASFRLLNRLDDAKTCLMEIVKNKKTIKHDRHLYSFACLELGIVLMGQEMFDECQQRLLEARQSIKKEDPMELFVQFRVGKALRMMRRLRDESSSSISDNNKISSQKITNNGNNVDGHPCNGIQQEMAVTVNGN
ncbi:Tetratricopeptide repeat protein 39B [Dermatophagoides pteronyssinus]|uniref:Tetratricopeptide repeat protein 39B n=1 Tax=Dermatophagoides pteronyssinus TaxID=6956 RepID=A0ABQ8J6N0_DERPT|nr:Tetratricopeptide repeat protein 39B [Dermatophagoides pteronyssinus]